VITIEVWSDLLCPFAHIAIHRVVTARAELGLDDQVQLDHHTFSLELFDGPHSRPGTDSEAVGLGQIAPELEFRLWTAPDWTYPANVLLAAEAVHAAKTQGLRASEDLDRALRKAFWTSSQPIGDHNTILSVARSVSTVDSEALAGELAAGTHRPNVMADHQIARTDRVKGSPHLFLPDGTSLHNPGIDVHWEGPWAQGYPIARVTDPEWAVKLLRDLV
jgi:predicted DsbA family dithiol-disulfide isomerase